MSDFEGRLQKVEDRVDILFGHLNALDLLAVRSILDFAKLQQNPFLFVQMYIDAIRKSAATLQTDQPLDKRVMRVLAETKAALEEHLEQVVMRASELRGSPQNPIK